MEKKDLLQFTMTGLLLGLLMIGLVSVSESREWDEKQSMEFCAAHLTREYTGRLRDLTKYSKDDIYQTISFFVFHPIFARYCEDLSHFHKRCSSRNHDCFADVLFRECTVEKLQNPEYKTFDQVFGYCYNTVLSTYMDRIKDTAA